MNRWDPKTSEGLVAEDTSSGGNTSDVGQTSQNTSGVSHDNVQQNPCNSEPYNNAGGYPAMAIWQNFYSSLAYANPQMQPMAYFNRYIPDLQGRSPGTHASQSISNTNQAVTLSGVYSNSGNNNSNTNSVSRSIADDVEMTMLSYSANERNSMQQQNQSSSSFLRWEQESQYIAVATDTSHYGQITPALSQPSIHTRNNLITAFQQQQSITPSFSLPALSNQENVMQSQPVPSIQQSAQHIAALPHQPRIDHSRRLDHLPVDKTTDLIRTRSTQPDATQHAAQESSAQGHSRAQHAVQQSIVAQDRQPPSQIAVNVAHPQIMALQKGVQPSNEPKTIRAQDLTKASFQEQQHLPSITHKQLEVGAVPSVKIQAGGQATPKVIAKKAPAKASQPKRAYKKRALNITLDAKCAAQPKVTTTDVHDGLPLKALSELKMRQQLKAVSMKVHIDEFKKKLRKALLQASVTGNQAKRKRPTTEPSNPDVINMNTQHNLNIVHMAEQIKHTAHGVRKKKPGCLKEDANSGKEGRFREKGKLDGKIDSGPPKKRKLSQNADEMMQDSIKVPCTSGKGSCEQEQRLGLKNGFTPNEKLMLQLKAMVQKNQMETKKDITPSERTLAQERTAQPTITTDRVKVPQKRQKGKKVLSNQVMNPIRLYELPNLVQENSVQAQFEYVVNWLATHHMTWFELCEETGISPQSTFLKHSTVFPTLAAYMKAIDTLQYFGSVTRTVDAECGVLEALKNDMEKARLQRKPPNALVSNVILEWESRPVEPTSFNRLKEAFSCMHDATHRCWEILQHAQSTPKGSKFCCDTAAPWDCADEISRKCRLFSSKQMDKKDFSQYCRLVESVKETFRKIIAKAVGYLTRKDYPAVDSFRRCVSLLDAVLLRYIKDGKDINRWNSGLADDIAQLLGLAWYKAFSSVLSSSRDLLNSSDRATLAKHAEIVQCYHARLYICAFMLYRERDKFGARDAFAKFKATIMLGSANSFQSPDKFVESTLSMPPEDLHQSPIMTGKIGYRPFHTVKATALKKNLVSKPQSSMFSKTSPTLHLPLDSSHTASAKLVPTAQRQLPCMALPINENITTVEAPCNSAKSANALRNDQKPVNKDVMRTSSDTSKGGVDSESCEAGNL